MPGEEGERPVRIRLHYFRYEMIVARTTVVVAAEVVRSAQIQMLFVKVEATNSTQWGRGQSRLILLG